MKKEKQETFEREYTILLREKTRSVPRYKKTNKAVRTIKEFLARHMKIYDRDLNKIKLDKYLNEYLWFRGIRKPPYKVKVKVKKDGEFIRAELVDLPEKLKFKKAREEKRESKAKSLKKEKPIEEKTEIKNELLEDKNKDGIEDKKEETEKKTAIIEAGQKFEKEEYKKQKHTTTEKMPTQKIQNEKTPKQNY